ncbi:hypothetical protein IC229_26965 [Spirosoma sp. BT702]|uniref:Outer membrane protein beta-barrel domain-containing protein n=1 Tax=Spirosoma profusum TaxID=2771354 RepID=A0A926Y578_9BACT|nr:hypothetical protein [Spirosoma profusum]MBD2704315.1 hypothetical protein [Spirosoma profusum]
MIKQYLLTSFLLLFISSFSFCQDSIQVKSNKSVVPFYKWEVGIDLLPLVDKAKDAYGYVLKRNYELASGRKALRLKVWPRFLVNPGTGVGGAVGTGEEKQTSINLALGYERQKLYGHFAVLYGLEPYFHYSLIRVLVIPSGLEAIRQEETRLGVAGFIGGRYYVGSHLSFTLESHLVYQYRDFSGNQQNVASYFQRTHQLFIEPIHALYVSYQF